MKVTETDVIWTPRYAHCSAASGTLIAFSK
jgi:hypothetical protein